VWALLADTPGAVGKGKEELIQEAEEGRAFMIRNQESERARQEQVLRCPPTPSRPTSLPPIRALARAHVTTRGRRRVERPRDVFRRACHTRFRGGLVVWHLLITLP